MTRDAKAVVYVASAFLIWIIIAYLATIEGLTYAQPSTPGQPLACGGGVTVLLNGAPLASGCVLNIQAGSGIVATPKADPAIGGTDISFSINTAVVPTHDTIHANELYCSSTNGTPAYTCNLPAKALTSLNVGSMFLLDVDATCAAACTLAIDPGVNIPAKSIKKADGTSDPQGSLIVGQAKLVWYDGNVFRLMF